MTHARISNGDVPMPQVICLTPVKNEAWILDRFLACASVWADRIIVADQGSDDGSREIMRRFPKVEVIDNGSRAFNEPERQKMLLAAARRIPGPKLLVALDADEFLTATFLESPEWAMALRAMPGTIVNFQWACVLPDRRSYYTFPTELPLGYMDDGAEHEGIEIHSPRLPTPKDRPRLSLRQVKVMHLSTIDFERFRSKVRWYQCWEVLRGRWSRRSIQLYRWYHRDFCVAPHLIEPLPGHWTAGYGVDVLNVPTQEFYRWDEELLRLFLAHGPGTFRRLAIWDVDWNGLYRRIHGTSPPVPLDDPRNWIERRVHRWLERTQPAYSHGAAPMAWTGRASHRLLERCLALTGW